MDFKTILEQALINVQGIKLAADVRTDLTQKGTSLFGSFKIRMEKEGTGELAEGVEEGAFNAAVLRLEGILDAKLIEDPLGNKFFSGNKKIKKATKAKVPVKPFGLRDKGGRLLSEQSLVRILNVRLFEQVKDKMGVPTLVFRTGRFASSAKVSSFTLSENRNPATASVFFTYMLYPYQVFEKHPTRDPRIIIKNALLATLENSLNAASFKQTIFNIGGPA